MHFLHNEEQCREIPDLRDRHGCFYTRH